MSAELAQRIITTWAEGGVEGIVPLIHPAFTGEVGPDTSVEPDTYQGHDGVRRYFALWEETISDLEIVASSVEEVRPDRAVAELRLSGRGVGSGVPVDFTAWTVMEFRDELLVRMSSVGDRETALVVAGAAGG